MIPSNRPVAVETLERRVLLSVAPAEVRGTPAGNRAPVALIAASRYDLPLGAPSVQLDASGSSDPDGGALSFAWDVNDDGDFTDASGPSPIVTWGQLLALVMVSRTYAVRVRVTDEQGLATVSGPAVLRFERPPTAPMLSPALPDATPFVPDMPPAVADEAGTGFLFTVRYWGSAPLEAASLDDRDVFVTNLGTATHEGQWARFVSLAANDAPSPDAPGYWAPAATYRFDAPGGTADPSDMGWFRVRIAGGSVVAADGASVFAADIGEVLAVMEATPPTATVTLPQVGADEVYDFFITYSDDTAVDRETIDQTEVELSYRYGASTGGPVDLVPNIPATRAGVQRLPDGSWLVRYRVTHTGPPAPEGRSSPFPRDGTYVVQTVGLGAPKDVYKNALTQSELGTVQVALEALTPLSSAPDLVASGVAWRLAAAAVHGARGAVSLSVSGNKAAAGRVADIAVVLSADDAFDPADAVIATFPARRIGGPGKVLRLSAPFAVPTGLADGAYRVLAVADAAGAVAEAREANNVAAGRRSMNVRKPAADLVVRLNRGDVALWMGKPLALSVGVRNDGTVAVRGPAELSARISPIRAQDQNAVPFYTRPLRLNLRPGGRARYKLNLKLPVEHLPGVYVLKVSVNWHGTPPEEHPGDNGNVVVVEVVGVTSGAQV